MRATTSPAAALLAAGLLAATGCGHDGEPASRCLPARLTVEPVRVEVGGQVTLAAPAAGCDLGYDDGASYEVTLAGRGVSVDLGDVDVAEDGSFRAVLTVPADVPPGPAGLSVRGSPHDDCDDTGSCAGYGVDLTLLPDR